MILETISEAVFIVWSITGIIGTASFILSICSEKKKLKIIIFCLAVAFGFLSTFWITTVPDVCGQTYVSAVSMLEQSTFGYASDIESPEDDQPVLSQSPKAGTHQWKYTTVKLCFLPSEEPEPVSSSAASEVPASPVDEGNAGSAVSSETTDSPGQPDSGASSDSSNLWWDHLVDETNETLSSPFFPNNSAASSGQVEVPNVVGMSLADAVDALCVSGLTPQCIDFYSGNLSPTCYASSQSQTAGSFVARGTTVILDYADGAVQADRKFDDFFAEFTGRCAQQRFYTVEELNTYWLWFSSRGFMESTFLGDGSGNLSFYAPAGLCPISVSFTNDLNAFSSLTLSYTVPSGDRAYSYNFTQANQSAYALLALGNYVFVANDGSTNWVGEISVNEPKHYVVTLQPV